MNEEDRKYRQGRSKERYEATAKGAMVAYIGIIIMVLYKLISGYWF
jgi:hypothetical protein